ncbi:MAG: DUF4340 domain-containing protein [Verrucomicrobiota bacterium]
MNKRQVIILWIIAIALGAAVTAVKLTQKDTRRSATHRAPGELLFESFPGSDVAHIEIQGAGGAVTLVKKDGKWTVSQRDAYPANVSYVYDFLRALGELKVTRGMEAGPSFAPRFGMDESATKVADRGLTAIFKDAGGKEIAKVSLGKNIENGADESPMGGSMAVGRYIRNHADESGFYASKEMFASVSAEPARWLADGFISPEKIKSITLSQVGKDDPAWKISRDSEEAEFKLENAAATEVLDTTAATPLKSLFSYARFDDVVTADKIAERADPAGKRTAVIETFEGFVYTVTLTPAKAGTTPPPAPDPSNPASSSTDKMLLTVTVTAELPKERKKEKDEKSEDAKTKDTAFAERLKTLTEKLTTEKALAGRTFEIGKTSVDALLKERAQLIAKATPPPAGGASNGSLQKLPGGFISPPPGNSVTTKPIEAVTPPIAVPPTEENK